MLTLYFNKKDNEAGIITIVLSSNQEKATKFGRGLKVRRLDFIVSARR